MVLDRRNYYAKGYMFSNKLGKWVYYLEDSDALFIYMNKNGSNSDLSELPIAGT